MLMLIIQKYLFVYPLSGLFEHDKDTGTDHEHPPLSLKEVLSVSDSSLDLIAPLNVCVVNVSPALQQHVSHEEHKRAELLLFLHSDRFNG